MTKWGFHCNDLIWYHTWPPEVLGRGVHVTKCQHDQKPPKAWSLGGGVHVMLLFLYTPETLEDDIYLFHIVIFYIFFFLSGNACHNLWVKWHGMADEAHPQGRYFNEMLQNILLKYISFSIPPTFFKGLRFHLKFTYPYHCYLYVKLLDGDISLNIDIFCYIFLIW